MSDGTVYLAYGVDLGYSEAPGIEEVDEYGTPNLEWLRRDVEGYPTDSFDVAVLRRLYEQIPGVKVSAEDELDSWDMVKAVKNHYGVEVVTHGWPSLSQESWILAAWYKSAEAGDVVFAEDARPDEGDTDVWSARIGAAIAALGVTLKNPTIGIVAGCTSS
jgi:hypothetical protein